MNDTNYPINKGINTSIVFKGLKAQYIWYLGGAMLLLLVLYALLYVCGVNTYLSLAIVLILGALSIMFIYHLSAEFGEHGLAKALARRSVPPVVKAGSRRIFIRALKQDKNDGKKTP